MIEKRSQPRYIPRLPTTISLRLGGVEVEGHLGDISARGCLLLLPPVERTRMQTLRELAGQIGTERCDARWEGAITHQSAVRCHHGIGIRFAQPMPGIVEAMLAHQDVGGMRVRQWEATVQGEVIGHLGFNLNRQFIALVRQGRLTHVDLAACSGIDSAGIGLLAIARDAGIAIGGARGSIRTLLGLARLDSRSAGHPTRH